MSSISRSVIFYAIILVPFSSLKSQDNLPLLLDKLQEKDTLTLLITDSGLGGISVVADVERRAREGKAFSQVRLVFFNAQPEPGAGYNKMKAMDRKAAVFDDVLKAMCDRYSPDAIFVACNTLSVVYPFTRHSHTASPPVVGIVGMGIDMIAEELARNTSARAIIFGTETTIAAGAHREGLIKRGIPSERLVVQACPGLAGQIEEGAASESVQNSIERFVQEALRPWGKGGGAIVAGLCCTHYGFSQAIFEQQVKNAGAGSVVMVNPNVRMSGLLFLPERRGSHPRCETSVEVVSRMPLTPQERKTIGELVRPVSERTADALEGYRHIPDLFPFERSAN